MFNDGIACFFATMGSSSTPALLHHHNVGSYWNLSIVEPQYSCHSVQWNLSIVCTVEPQYSGHSVQWNLSIVVTLYSGTSV